MTHRQNHPAWILNFRSERASENHEGRGAAALRAEAVKGSFSPRHELSASQPNGPHTQPRAHTAPALPGLGCPPPPFSAGPHCTLDPPDLPKSYFFHEVFAELWQRPAIFLSNLHPYYFSYPLQKCDDVGTVGPNLNDEGDSGSPAGRCTHRHTGLVSCLHK